MTDPFVTDITIFVLAIFVGEEVGLVVNLVANIALHKLK